MGPNLGQPCEFLVRRARIAVLSNAAQACRLVVGYLGFMAVGIAVFLSSEKDAKLAQKLGQLQPFIPVFLQECMGQLAYFGPI